MLHSKRAWLKSSETRHQLAFVDGSVADRKFLTVNFVRRNHRRRKSDTHVRLFASIELDDPHDQFVCVFGFLQCEDTDATTVCAQDRKRLAELAWMLRTLKRDQRLVQTLRVPVSLRATIIAGVCCESVNDHVSPPIL